MWRAVSLRLSALILSCAVLCLIDLVDSPDSSCFKWPLWGGGTTRRERSQYPGPGQCKGKHIIIQIYGYMYIYMYIHTCHKVYTGHSIYVCTFINELINVCIYEFIYVWYVYYLYSMYFTCCLSVFLIGWMYCPLLCCSGRPPPGRRDSPGPGGRHRGQDQGKQIQQPLLCIIYFAHRLQNLCMCLWITIRFSFKRIVSASLIDDQD